jgi:hypothetical protein
MRFPPITLALAAAIMLAGCTPEQAEEATTPTEEITVPAPTEMPAPEAAVEPLQIELAPQVEAPAEQPGEPPAGPTPGPPADPAEETPPGGPQP